MNRGPFCVHFCLKDLEETEICCTLHGGIQNRSPVHTHHFVGGLVADILENLEIESFLLYLCSWNPRDCHQTIHVVRFIRVIITWIL